MKGKHRIINAVRQIAMQGIKPYDIVDDGEDVEINMFGEVVETVPTDWWTGEPVNGLFIELKEFLKDIDDLKGKNSITVRINSIGGDLYAGVSIYNRLKEMNSVTTIVDGLAASAASIIAQAGSVRKIYTSGQIMIHSASVGLCDYYNTQQLEEVMNMLKSANDAVIGVYAERTGETKTKLRHMVEKTTWMTGQEAVEMGFADEVIQGNVTMSMSSDRSFFLCNGIPLNARRLASIPNNVTVIQEQMQPQVGADRHEKGGSKMTIEQIREKYPEAVRQIEDEAKRAMDTADSERKAREEERQRIKDIESIEASIADKKMIEEAKYGDRPMDAKDLAFMAMQKQAQLGNNFLNDLKDDLRNSGANDVGASPNHGPESGGKDEEADIMAAVNAVKQMKGAK